MKQELDMALGPNRRDFLAAGLAMGAVPLLPREHDPPQGRLHFVVAVRY